MTTKELLHKAIDEMTDEQAESVAALLRGSGTSTAPTDIYGTPWGSVLEGSTDEALMVQDAPTIAIPPGIPASE